MARPGEIRLEGAGVAPGVASGPAYVRDTGALDVPEYTIPRERIGDERKRLEAAIRLARMQINRLRDVAAESEVADDMAFLFDAYLQMLKDSRLVRGPRARIVGNLVNAEAAVQAELHDLMAAFQAMDDAYLAARVEDVREVGNRLLRNLMRKPIRAFSAAPEGSVLMAESLSPADAAQLDPARVSGVVTEIGGAEGHSAIMARALGIPLVLGISNLVTSVETGTPVVIDGTRGIVVLNPTARTRDVYQRISADDAREEARFARLREVPAITRDKVDIRLHANVELPIEMDMVEKNGAGGIGLLRTEFMFMARDDVPSEEEQYETLKGIVERLNGQTATIRTLDVGGEKPARALLGDLDEAAASALGLRGIRLSLSRDDVLEPQLRAILRVSAHGPVRILLPMVSNVTELKRTRRALEKAARDLRRDGVPVVDPPPPLGAMIEVPAAALSADALAHFADFFAVGSNDLTMYTLATDRTNEHVSHLFDPLHPGVLRLIQFTASAALRNRVPISLCGEMAGDPRYTPLLLGLGIRELSMVPSAIPRVKQRIRDMDLGAAASRANAIMDQVDPARIAMLLDDFNGLA